MTDLIEGTLEKARAAIATHDLVAPDAAVLLMVSGGSDSTALAYLGAALREAGDVGPVAMLHVNHQLRGEDADADERFVAALAEALDIPLFICSIDIAAEAERSRENVEAVARRERYLAANEALRSMCQHEGRPLSEACIFTAHTADDRIENFYMRSIVGTGPGGFRSMLYRNGPVVRPLLDLTRDELRDYLSARESAGETVVRDESGALARGRHQRPHRPLPRLCAPQDRAGGQGMEQCAARGADPLDEPHRRRGRHAAEHGRKAGRGVRGMGGRGRHLRYRPLRGLPPSARFWKSGAPAAASRGAASFGSDARPGCAGGSR